MDIGTINLGFFRKCQFLTISILFAAPVFVEVLDNRSGICYGDRSWIRRKFDGYFYSPKTQNVDRLQSVVDCFVRF